MRSLLAAVLLLIALPAAHAEVSIWNFRVLLDGREIGKHQFTVQRSGDWREVRSESQYDVRVVFVNVYRYLHEAVERWNGNCLQSLASRTEINGESKAVNAAVRGDRLRVERSEGRDEHEGCVMTFAYWNPQILKAQRLLNSQTGEFLAVKITARGEQSIEVRGKPLIAQRHRISGPSLQIDLWYAGEQWIALEAQAQGGRRLRYELM